MIQLKIEVYLFGHAYNLPEMRWVHVAPLGEKINIFDLIDIYSHFLSKITNYLVNFFFTIQIAYFNEKKYFFYLIFLKKQ